jgi:hypothetical protein
VLLIVALIELCCVWCGVLCCVWCCVGGGRVGVARRVLLCRDCEVLLLLLLLLLLLFLLSL